MLQTKYEFIMVFALKFTYKKPCHVLLKLLQDLSYKDKLLFIFNE